MNTGRDCQYFTMMRHPIDRLVSAFFYCPQDHDVQHRPNEVRKRATLRRRFARFFGCDTPVFYIGSPRVFVGRAEKPFLVLHTVACVGLGMPFFQVLNGLKGETSREAVSFVRVVAKVREVTKSPARERVASPREASSPSDIAVGVEAQVRDVLGHLIWVPR